MDGNAVAAVIAAAVAAIVSLVGVYMQFMTWKDNREIKRSQARLEIEGSKREGKIDALHSQVNGRLGELKVRIAKEAFEMGRGFEKENPGAPSPLFPRSQVDFLLDEINGNERRDGVNQDGRSGE